MKKFIKTWAVIGLAGYCGYKIGQGSVVLKISKEIVRYMEHKNNETVEIDGVEILK